jgi:hypothetical protein
MMNLILWESNVSLFPSDREERMKLIMSHIEMTKQGVEEGWVKMWGVSLGGGQGFSVTDRDAKEIFGNLNRYMPYYKFEIKPMLSIDEIADVMKEMQQ